MLLLGKQPSQQKQVRVHWKRGADAGYVSKHHSQAHHKLKRSRYLLQLHKPRHDLLLAGCVDPGNLKPLDSREDDQDDYTMRINHVTLPVGAIIIPVADARVTCSRLGHPV
jgi:hypothetical protein